MKLRQRYGMVLSEVRMRWTGNRSGKSIRDGTYPLTVAPYVQKMLDFILSDDGQEIIEKAGCAPLIDRNVAHPH